MNEEKKILQVICVKTKFQNLQTYTFIKHKIAVGFQKKKKKKILIKIQKTIEIRKKRAIVYLASFQHKNQKLYLKLFFKIFCDDDLSCTWI